jgi:hypothetical protein
MKRITLILRTSEVLTTLFTECYGWLSTRFPLYSLELT